MKTYFVIAVSAIALMAGGSLGLQKAQAAPVSIAIPESAGLVQDAQFIYGDEEYCFYLDGWQGPGWYWCGYSWRYGLGWGGYRGWRGWAVPQHGGRGWGGRPPRAQGGAIPGGRSGGFRQPTYPQGAAPRQAFPQRGAQPQGVPQRGGGRPYGGGHREGRGRN